MHKQFKTWWLLFAVGVALACAGIFSLINPFHAFLRAVGYAGLALFANGILLSALASAPAHKAEKNWLIVESVVDFLFATALVFNPMMTFIILPLLIGNWMFCIGIVKILASLSLRKHFHGWVFVLITGLLTLLFSILVSYNPIGKASGSVTLLGVFCLLLGTLNVFDALRFKKASTTLNMML